MNKMLVNKITKKFMGKEEKKRLTVAAAVLLDHGEAVWASPGGLLEQLGGFRHGSLLPFLYHGGGLILLLGFVLALALALLVVVLLCGRRLEEGAHGHPMGGLLAVRAEGKEADRAGALIGAVKDHGCVAAFPRAVVDVLHAVQGLLHHELLVAGELGRAHQRGHHRGRQQLTALGLRAAERQDGAFLDVHGAELAQAILAERVEAGPRPTDHAGAKQLCEAHATGVQCSVKDPKCPGVVKIAQFLKLHWLQLQDPWHVVVCRARLQLLFQDRH